MRCTFCSALCNIVHAYLRGVLCLIQCHRLTVVRMPRMLRLLGKARGDQLGRRGERVSFLGQEKRKSARKRSRYFYKYSRCKSHYTWCKKIP